MRSVLRQIRNSPCGSGEHRAGVVRSPCGPAAQTPRGWRAPEPPRGRLTFSPPGGYAAEVRSFDQQHRELHGLAWRRPRSLTRRTVPDTLRAMRRRRPQILSSRRIAPHHSPQARGLYPQRTDRSIARWPRGRDLRWDARNAVPKQRCGHQMSVVGVQVSACGLRGLANQDLRQHSQRDAGVRQQGRSGMRQTVLTQTCQPSSTTNQSHLIARRRFAVWMTTPCGPRIRGALGSRPQSAAVKPLITTT